MNNIFKKLSTFISFVFIINYVSAVENSIDTKPIYLDESQPIENRIEDALSRMTLSEKIKMCHAQSKFSSAGVPRLGIPENWMTDGPHGIRAEVLWDEWNQAGWTTDSCFAFPALTCLSASWNPDLAYLYGKSIGEEARYRNKNVLLGPGINIYRTPLNGRNFEYMGEDPYLSAQMVVPYVQGVQTNGVAACVKHFALNNQETNRHTVNIDVGDRALHEIYLPAFKAAIQKGQAWAIMGAYNLYKNQWCCHNEYLLNDILRDDWKFDGVVVSDWGGVKNTEQAIYNGLDMEFGTWTDGLSTKGSGSYDNYFLAKPFKDLIISGQVDEEELNKKVRNILRLVFRTNMNTKRPWGSFNTPEHSIAGKKIAEEGIVLLKNSKNVLPIRLESSKKIAVIGENAIKKMTVGGGSSSLKASYEISPLEGLKNLAPNSVEINYARGYVGDVLNSYNNVETGIDLTDNRSKEELIQEACELAKDADYVIFVGGLNKARGQDSESRDRKNMDLPYAQNELIETLSGINPNLVVVLISGNAVAMPWVNNVSSIVQTWYLGSEAGNAIASILYGHANPSGKLPFSFPVTLNDIGAHYLDAFPGDNNLTYKEGIFVGYRWLEKEKIKPLFAFGHGLSYTNFKYGNTKIDSKRLHGKNDKIVVSIPVKNTGTITGKEIVQLYIREIKPSVARPVKELKAFQKVELNPSEEQILSFNITEDMLQYYDDVLKQWKANPGKFEVLIGAASDDIKQRISFTYKP